MKTVPVKVSINRTTNGVKVTVDPFVAVIDKGDQVEWVLDSDYSSAKATIEKKNLDDYWSFDTDPPLSMDKDKPKKSAKTKDRPRKKQRYNIEVTVSDGKTSTVFSIDPDIIIIGGFDS